MTIKNLALCAFLLITPFVFTQQLDTLMLHKYFESLERRNEIMGSITIAKNGTIVFEKAIGYRSTGTKESIVADVNTNYRIGLLRNFTQPP